MSFDIARVNDIHYEIIRYHTETIDFGPSWIANISKSSRLNKLIRRSFSPEAIYNLIKHYILNQFNSFYMKVNIGR